MTRERKITRNLWHAFTEGEARERGTTLAALLEERRLVEERKADANKGFRDELTALDEEIKRAGQTIREHGETRATECVVKFHSPVTGTKEVYRADGGELVETVAMSAEECQEHLFAQPDKAEGASA